MAPFCKYPTGVVIIRLGVEVAEEPLGKIEQLIPGLVRIVAGDEKSIPLGAVRGVTGLDIVPMVCCCWESCEELETEDSLVIFSDCSEISEPDWFESKESGDCFCCSFSICCLLRLLARLFFEPV